MAEWGILNRVSALLERMPFIVWNPDNTYMYIFMYAYIYTYGSVSLIHGSNKSTVPLWLNLVDPSWAIHRSRRVHMRQQTCLLCDTAGTSARSHSGHIGCVTQQTCLLRDTADTTQQTCLLCDTGDTPAVPHSKHPCCVAQQACLLSHTADMSAVPQS